MNIATRLLVAFVPLLLTLVFAALVSGPLSLGGGEKDIFLAIPLLFWSVVFLICHVVLWRRRLAAGRSIAVSAGFATALTVIALVALAVGLPAWR